MVVVVASVFLVREAIHYAWLTPKRPTRLAALANTGLGFSYPTEPARGFQNASANLGGPVRHVNQGQASVGNQPNPINSPILGLGGSDRGGARSEPAPNPRDLPGAGDAADDALSRGLRATRLDGTRARELPDPTFLITAGRLIPCRLQTAMNTEHPGVLAALIGENIMGDTGTMTALDAGSRIVGSVGQRQSDTGVTTAYVLWQRIITPPLYDERGLPHEYSVEADSPASNEMGETGMEGRVDRHYRTKIPAIIGISLLEALPNAAGAAITAGTGGFGGNSAVALNLTESGARGVQSAADAWLNRILSQADTVRALVGSNHCALMLARDLDMNPIYQLKLRSGGTPQPLNVDYGRR